MIPVKFNSNRLPSVWNQLFDSEILNPDTFFHNGAKSAPANIYTHDDSFEIQIEAPGFNKEDFEITLEGDQMTISGKTELAEEKSDRRIVKREFQFGNFKRSFTLPDTANKDKIKASYENGILFVKIEKEARAIPQRKTITIK